jgi:hypothetical protein
MTRLHTSLPLASLLLLGCAVSGEELDAIADPGGKADIVGSAELLFVYDNGTRCIVAPCPSYTVITAAGESFPAAGVVIPGDPDGEARAALHQGGLLVEAEVEFGSWDPFEPGTVVHALSIVGPAEEHVALYEVRLSGVFCITSPCPTWSVTDEDGTEELVAGIELGALDLEPEAEEELLGQLVSGAVLARGFIAYGSWQPFGPGDVLVVIETY